MNSTYIVLFKYINYGYVINYIFIELLLYSIYIYVWIL